MRNSPAPPHLVDNTRTTAYLQGQEPTCYIDAFCSTLHAFGAVQGAFQLNREHRPSLTQRVVNLKQKLVQAANKAIGVLQLTVRKVPPVRTVEDILFLGDTWPLVLLLSSSDGGHGQHAVGVWNNRVYETNAKSPLFKTAESLHWCCGDDVTCCGAATAYQILPRGFKGTPGIAGRLPDIGLTDTGELCWSASPGVTTADLVLRTILGKRTKMRRNKFERSVRMFESNRPGGPQPAEPVVEPLE